MELWNQLFSSPTILIAALLIGTLGEVVKRAVDSKEIEQRIADFHVDPKSGPQPVLWQRVFYYTLPAHSVLMGVALGFVPWLPAVAALERPGYELAARLGTYTMAGIFCKIGYDLIISTAKRALKKNLSSSRRSTPPPPPAPADGGNG